ncbi:hypothetical protein ACIB24_13075 [Spongisporangium articulatum]|uniref:Nucleotidyltransferase n=1 Tax=Spongisporangium articulatum TaxID=3362603 RepID=A0ABW8ANR6_9ACTN
MLTATRGAEGLLDPVAQIVREIRDQAPEITPDRVMLVGAWCRDTLHACLGHEFSTSATRDIDLAVALSGWDSYNLLARSFPRTGDSGVRFSIAGLPVDLIPFGEPEDPRGTVVPPTRGEAISVWAFSEIFEDSRPLAVDPTLDIRCPTVPGYTAAKLAAWLDRSAWGEVKDANDLALAAYWYAESKQVEDELYDSPRGQEILVAEEADVERAAARLLGSDVSTVLGPERVAELMHRWPGDLEMLVHNFTATFMPPWLSRSERRREIVDALTRGLAPPD